MTTSITRRTVGLTGLLLVAAIAAAIPTTAAPEASAQTEADPVAVYTQLLSDVAVADVNMAYALSWEAAGVQENGLATLAAENAARAQFIAAAEEAQRREALADYLRGRSSGSESGGSSASSRSRCAGDFACFKECTLDIESDGNYGAISPGGTYRGAWQFDQPTWNSNSAASGRYDLVGIDPATAAPGDQDAIAYDLYQRRGNQPWGGRC
jgi:hypothetical protein